MNESDKPIHNAAIASLALAIAGLFIFGVLAGLGAVGAGFYAKNQIAIGVTSQDSRFSQPAAGLGGLQDGPCACARRG